VLCAQLVLGYTTGGYPDAAMSAIMAEVQL
jgi:hypothetical protein